MMKIIDKKIVFHSGKEIFLYGIPDSTIGISENLEVSAGSDAPLYDPDFDRIWDDEPSPGEFLTPQERSELADFMILRWKEFKTKYGNKEK
jgi:hypothetical protein